MNELAPMLDKWMPEPEPEFTPGHTESPAVRPEPIPMHLAAVIESTHPIWNPATLTELVGDNPDMHKRLLAKFLLNAEKQVAEITTAAANRDSAALAGVAHTLKSAARSVGALRLGELCQSLETAARAGDAQQCSALAARMDVAFAAGVAAINGHLSL
jgi:HPt (histidine-containing phosphotransfer) domain-containing protein